MKTVPWNLLLAKMARLVVPSIFICSIWLSLRNPFLTIRALQRWSGCLEETVKMPPLEGLRIQEEISPLVRTPGWGTARFTVNVILLQFCNCFIFSSNMFPFSFIYFIF